MLYAIGLGLRYVDMTQRYWIPSESRKAYLHTLSRLGAIATGFTTSTETDGCRKQKKEMTISYKSL